MFTARSPSVTKLPTNVGFYGSLTWIIFKPLVSSATTAKIFAPILIMLTSRAYPSVSKLPTNVGFYGSLTSMIFKPFLRSATNA